MRRRPRTACPPAGLRLVRCSALGATAAAALTVLADAVVVRRIVARFDERDAKREAFLANAAHELRTPMASMHLILGLLVDDLEREAPDMADARAQAARAAALSGRLTRLCLDLLDLSRLDAGARPSREPLALSGLARAVAQEFDPSGERVAVRPPTDGEVWARGDGGAIAQVIRILVDNAIRFAPPGTAVAVSVRRRAGRAEVGVCDRGPGVSARERERIFERFYRGPDAAAGQGFGLGLAIGRELARGMGGELELRSPAAPTCFVVDLPLARVRPHRGANVRERGLYPATTDVRLDRGGAPRAR